MPVSRNRKNHADKVLRRKRRLIQKRNELFKKFKIEQEAKIKEHLAQISNETGVLNDQQINQEEE